MDPEDWFPAGYGPAYVGDIAYARSLCAACPVRRSCLNTAMREEGGQSRTERSGIRGGLTPRQRHDLYVSRREQSRTGAAA
jgi:positive regulator of sigma E activity